MNNWRTVLPIVIVGFFLLLGTWQPAFSSQPYQEHGDDPTPPPDGPSGKCPDWSQTIQMTPEGYSGIELGGRTETPEKNTPNSRLK
jgi:hypothetical protein